MELPFTAIYLPNGQAETGFMTRKNKIKMETTTITTLLQQYFPG